MTDGRFPERWLNDRTFGRLSPEAQMLFVAGNAWSASNRTDGDIRRDDLELFPRWVHTDRAAELVKAGFWIEDRDGWQIAGYAKTQTTAAQLDAAEQSRAHNRERQARRRLRGGEAAGQRPVTRDVTRDVAREGTGQATTGQDRPGAVNGTDDETDVWPTTRAPGSGLRPVPDALPDDSWQALASGYDH